MSDPQPHDPQIAWFLDTAHCGNCGQPGDYCLCTPRNPCGCRDLHPLGSGLQDGALDRFIEVSDDQEGLW